MNTTVEYAPVASPTTTPTPAPTSKKDVDLRGRVMKIRFTTHCPTFSRKDRTQTERVLTATGATKGAASVNKKLIDGPMLTLLRGYGQKLRDVVDRWTTPTGTTGERAMLTPNYMDFTREWNAVHPAYLDARNQFLTHYSHLIAARRADLGTMYDSDEFPPLSVMRDQIGVELHVSVVADPREVSGLADAIIDAATADFDTMLAESRKSVWQTLMGHVAALTTALKGAERIHETHWTKLADFIDRAPKLLPGEDSELEGHLDELKELLLAAPKDVVRDSDDIRDQARQVAEAKLEQLKNKFATLGV